MVTTHDELNNPGSGGTAAIEAGLEAAPPGEPEVRTIVLGLGGTADDAEALRWASMLARTHGARVVAVHAVPTMEGLLHDMPPFGLGNWRVSLRREIERRWCRPLLDAGVSVEVRLMEEGAGHALLSTAAAVHADVVVIGSRAAKGMGAGGNLAGHLTRRSPCPVLVVPPAA